MISNKAIKIFIEPEEEIVFIIEKIIATKSNRVILIVPHNALLISSAVSLKMLAKQIIKTEILIVLVSDTELALSLGSKAKLPVCRKVSEVSKDVWQQAQDLKQQLLDERNRIKNELLSVRQEPLGEPLRVEDLIKKVLPVKKSKADMAEEKPTIKPGKVKAVIVDEPETRPEIIKARLKERVTDINGIKLVVGGDILKNEDLVEMERSRLSGVLVINQKKEDNTDTNNYHKDDMYKDSGLVGKDMTKQLSDSPYTEINTARVVKPKTSPAFFKTIANFFQQMFKYVSVGKLVLGFAIAFIVFFIISYFFFTSAKVEVEQSATSFKVKKSITAKIDDVNAYDIEKLIIPASSITKDATLSSETAATGEGQTGEYAQGDLLIYNPTANSITIKAGQVFSYNYNDAPLKYKALQEVVIPSASTENTIVKVKAESFGEKYNITSTLKNFLIEGVTGMTAQNITAITGGTTVATKVVSQENIDDLKASLDEQLKTQLLTAMKATLSEDDILIAGSEKFKEEEFKTSVQAETPADKFTADLKLSISAVIVSKIELKQLLEELAKIENEYSQVEISDPVIENIVVAEKEVTFDVRANAIGMTEIDLEVITAEIKGKGVTEAKEYIKSQPGVSNVKIQFTPPYIPQSLQRIPTEDAKLVVKSTMLEAK